MCPGWKGRRDLPGKSRKQGLGQQGRGTGTWCSRFSSTMMFLSNSLGYYNVSKATAKWSPVSELPPISDENQMPLDCELSVIKVCSIDIHLVECGKIVSFHTCDALQLQLGHCWGFPSLSLCPERTQGQHITTKTQSSLSFHSPGLSSRLLDGLCLHSCVATSPVACFKPGLSPWAQSHLLRAWRVNCVRAWLWAADHARH